MSSDVKYAVGQSDNRPWGRWQVVDVGSFHIVKRISVNPGEKLSLQSHQFRDEHWVIVEGSAQVTLGEELLKLYQNDNVFIPKTVKHRIENIGDSELIFIEVQAGSALDESDIQRFNDQYGRS